jgi:glycosyltransferase involved in cell wall biosynthesis
MGSTSLPRVLVLYWLSRHGGVRQVLGDGLPRLCSRKTLSVYYADLSGNQDDMGRLERAGIPVMRDLGVSGSASLSERRGWRRSWDLASSLPRLLRIVISLSRHAPHFDVLYVHSYRELVIASIALLGVRRTLRPALVWHCHGLDDGLAPPCLAVLANHCSAVVAISSSVSRRLMELGVKSQSIAVVANAIALRDADCGALATPQDVPDRRGLRVLLLPTASIRHEKGVHLAVRALPLIDYSVHLWVTGDVQDAAAGQYLKGLTVLADELGVSHRLHFIGHRADLPSIMKLADLVVVPSVYREGFGLVAAEAMLAERPLIVSTGGALPEVLGGVENGWIFDASSHRDLARCISNALAYPEEAVRRSKGARLYAESHYSYSRWVTEIESILTEVSGSQQPS